MSEFIGFESGFEMGRADRLAGWVPKNLPPENVECQVRISIDCDDEFVRGYIAGAFDPSLIDN